MESRDRKISEMNYKYRKINKPYNYQRNQGFYFGNRGHNFTNNYSNNGTSTSFPNNAFYSRHARYYQHNRRESLQSYKEYHWQQSRKVRREPSPLNGSEEYTLRKIQETSDMIKRKLMSPEYTADDSTNNKVSEPINNKPTKVKIKFNKIKINKEAILLKRKLRRKADLRAKLYDHVTLEKSSNATYNVQEIHDQIMNHISKLNYGRRQNLINADTTCYDTALQQMYKQKSLELSKALREMSHQEKPEASEVVNSIIPDFAIKFEELPIHVIRELSSTFETLEKNIGNDNTTSPFDYITYSTEDQGNPIPIYNDYQEYIPNRDNFQTDSTSNVNYVESEIDDRVLVLNSEDADTLVIKEENIDEILIKMETNDMEIEHEANNEDKLAHSLPSSQVSSELHPEVMGESIQDDMNNAKFHSDNRLDISPDSKTAVCTQPSADIGSVRVSQSIFESTNSRFENQNENPSREYQNAFTTNSNSGGLIPSLRVSRNLFEKREENSSTEIRSSICDDMSIAGTLETTPIQDNTNIVKFHSDNRLDISSDSKTAVCTQPSTVIGTVGVSQSIFESTNSRFETQNENPSREYQNAFTTDSNSGGLIPSLRVSKNLFEKREENSSTEIRSSICDDMSIAGTLETSPSTYIKNNESSHQQMKENNIMKSKNTVGTIRVKNNISLENKYHSFQNDCEMSTSHIEKSSDNLNLSCTSSPVNLPLLKKAGNSTKQQKKQTVNSTVSPKTSFGTDSSFDDSNITCHSRDTSFMSNSQHSKENQSNKGNFEAEKEDNYFSVFIKKFQKPQDTAEAVKIMFEIDDEIDKLTKIRQSLISSLIDQKPKDSKKESLNNSISNKKKKKNNSKAKKKKLNSQKNQDEMTCPSFLNEKTDSSPKNSHETIPNEDTLTNSLNKHLEEKNDFQQKNKSSTLGNQNQIQDIRNIVDLDVNNLTGVPIICKVLRQENSLIIGTDNGKILYFDLCSSEKPSKPFTVGISKHAISCLDYAYVGAELLIFTGTAAETNLKILRYKKGGNSKTVQLEDTIQAMQKEWAYFFIGGTRGYLTRYNYQRDKIEFEDKISEMTLKDLRATREGPRKILIILFKDIFGNHHIHVRDAMSALHMRSIGEQMITPVTSLLVKDSSLFFSYKNEILVYNYCDGQFITKLTIPSQDYTTFLHKNGNLLLACTSNGIVHAYDFKGMISVGYIHSHLISLLIVLQDKIIIGSWSKSIKSMTIPKHMLKIR